MFNIGEEVAFFSLNEEFPLVEFKDIDNFVKECTWYVIEDMGDNWLSVKSSSGTRTIHVDNFDNEYSVYTRTQLKEQLVSLKSNDKYTAICTKIKQLYRKQEFKFQGV